MTGLTPAAGVMGAASDLVIPSSGDIGVGKLGESLFRTSTLFSGPPNFGTGGRTFGDVLAGTGSIVTLSHTFREAK